MLGQGLCRGKGLATDTPAQQPQVLLAKACVADQAKFESQLGVVAQVRVGIEWQMVGKQVDVMRQQQGQPLFHPAGDAAILPTPELPRFPV